MTVVECSLLLKHIHVFTSYVDFIYESVHILHLCIVTTNINICINGDKIYYLSGVFADHVNNSVSYSCWWFSNKFVFFKQCRTQAAPMSH